MRAVFRVIRVLAALAPLACGSPSVEKANPGLGDASLGPGRADGPGFGFNVPDAGALERPAPGAPIGNGPSCAFQAFTAERLPLDLVILVDASGSMANPVAGATRSKWQLVQEALYAFVKDPASAGLGIGLQFLPLAGSGTPCTSRADCGLTDPGAPQWCEQHKACVAPGGSPAGAPGCSPFDLTFCPAGTSCQSLGACAVTGVECAGIGSPCPGGVAGDTCAVQPTTCWSALPICAPDSYQKLAAPIADLPGAGAAFIRALALRRPGGETPISQAAIGAHNHLRARLTAMPRRRAALVLATDGLPGGCGNQDIPTIADSLYTARTTSPTVPTYVIGVLDEAAQAQAGNDFKQLAAGGGSKDPFILTPNSDLTRKLLAALGEIRGDALACEYVIPDDKKASIDFNQVNLHFTGAAAEEDVPYVARAGRCDPARGGWYYDNDPQSGGTPSRVIACEATCRRFRAEPTGKVELRFGCKTVVIQ
jgi:hypothetical protein